MGEAISNDKARFDLFKLLLVYQDVEAITLKNILPTDLIIDRIQFNEGTKIYKAEYQQLSQDYEWWLCRIIEKSIGARMYEKTVTVNSRLSKLNTNPVFIYKLGQV